MFWCSAAEVRSFRPDCDRGSVWRTCRSGGGGEEREVRLDMSPQRAELFPASPAALRNTRSGWGWGLSVKFLRLFCGFSLEMKLKCSAGLVRFVVFPLSTLGLNKSVSKMNPVRSELRPCLGPDQEQRRPGSAQQSGLHLFPQSELSSLWTVAVELSLTD